MKKNTQSFLWVLFISLLSLTANAQLKINCGYSLGYANPVILNQVYNNYNESFPVKNKSFSNFHVTHGIMAGLRYELEFVGVEASWIYSFNDNNASVITANQEVSSTQLAGRFNILSLGLDNQFDWFAYGGSIDYNIHKLKATKDDSGNRINFLDEKFTSATFYLGFNTSRSNQVRLSVRPYLTIPLTELDYQKIDINLNGNNTIEETKDKPLMFGLRLVFTNG